MRFILFPSKKKRIGGFGGLDVLNIIKRKKKGHNIVSQSHRESGLLSKIPIYFCCPNIFFNILRHTTAHNSSSLFFPAAHYSTQRHTTAHPIFSFFSSSTLQHTAAHYSTQRHTTAHKSSSLFFPAAHYSTQQHTTAHNSSSLFFPAAHYSTQRHTTAHPIFSFFSSSTLQHTAAHYNTHILPYLLFQQQHITTHHKKKIKIK